MEIGDYVRFTDERGVQHDALLTMVWNNGQPEKFPTPAVNLLYVDGAADKTDQYGRQIVRKTSVVHQDNQSAHGYFYELVS